jgi:hypothetical protein
VRVVATRLTVRRIEWGVVLSIDGKIFPSFANYIFGEIII